MSSMVSISQFAATSNVHVSGSNQVSTPFVFTQPLGVSTSCSACNVSATGRVGIKAANPSFAVDLEQGRIRCALSNATMDGSTPVYGYNAQVVGSYATTGEHAGICFTAGISAMNGSNATVPGAAITYNRTGEVDFRGDLFFKTNTAVGITTPMVVTSTGRVGIGMSNPAYALDVAGVIECDSIVQLNSSNGIQIIKLNPNELIEARTNSSNGRYGLSQTSGGNIYLYAGGDVPGSTVNLGFATNSNAYTNNFTITNSTSNILIGTSNTVFGALTPSFNFQVGQNANFTGGCTACFNTFGTSNTYDATNQTVPGVWFRYSDQYTFIHGNRIVIQGGNSSFYRLVMDTINTTGNIEAMNNNSNALQLNLNASKGGLVFVGSNMSVGSNLIVSGTGRMGVGTALPAYQLQLSTDSAAKPSTTTWTVASDQRVKENVQVADYGLCYSNVQGLDLKRYTYSSAFQEATDVQDTSKLGWIAQDVQSVYPKAIREVDAPEYGLSNMLNVDFGQVYAMMYGALRAAMSNLDGLESVVASMEA